MVLVDFSCKWSHTSLHTVVFKLAAPEPPPNVPETMNSVPTTSNNTFPKSNHTSPTSNHRAPNPGTARSKFRATAAVDGGSARKVSLCHSYKKLIHYQCGKTSPCGQDRTSGRFRQLFPASLWVAILLLSARHPHFIRNLSMSHYCLQ